MSCRLAVQFFPIAGGKNGVRKNKNTAIKLKRSRDIAFLWIRYDAKLATADNAMVIVVAVGAARAAKHHILNAGRAIRA